MTQSTGAYTVFALRDRGTGAAFKTDEYVLVGSPVERFGKGCPVTQNVCILRFPFLTVALTVLRVEI